jgi:NADP-dependent 3-hydroxy acid dehydrogenase YdfG
MDKRPTPDPQGRCIQSDDIKDAFRTAENRLCRIDVVYNNAGSPLVGELEPTPEEEARKTFDVNV